MIWDHYVKSILALLTTDLEKSDPKGGVYLFGQLIASILELVIRFKMRISRSKDQHKSRCFFCSQAFFYCIGDSRVDDVVKWMTVPNPVGAQNWPRSQLGIDEPMDVQKKNF